MNSVDRIELYEYVLNIPKNIESYNEYYQGCFYDIDILKDYSECKGFSGKKLSSCDLMKYKFYSPSKHKLRGNFDEKIEEAKKDEMEAKKIPGVHKPFTSDIPWDIPSYCKRSCLSENLLNKVKWIYSSFPNIYSLMDLFSIFNYVYSDKDIVDDASRAVVPVAGATGAEGEEEGGGDTDEVWDDDTDYNIPIIPSHNIGLQIISDGQRQKGIIDIFQTIMSGDEIITETNKVLQDLSDVWIRNKRTKYYEYIESEREEINKINDINDASKYVRIETKIFTHSANIIVIGDINGNIHSLMRILFRLYLTKVIGQNFKILVNNMFIVFTGNWFGRKDSVGSYIVFRLLMRLMYENMDQVIITSIPLVLDNPEEILEYIRNFKINIGIFSGEHVPKEEDIDEEAEETTVRMSESLFVNNLYNINKLLPSALVVKKNKDHKWIWIGNYVNVSLDAINNNIKNLIYKFDDDVLENPEMNNNNNNVRYYISHSYRKTNVNISSLSLQNNYIVLGKEVIGEKVDDGDSAEESSSSSDADSDAGSDAGSEADSAGNGGDISRYVGGSHVRSFRLKIDKFANLRTLHRCNNKLCSGHTYEISIPEEKPIKHKYVGLETSTFMKKKDAFICLRMNIDPFETSFVHVIPDVIDVDENNYLQRMRNGKIYVEKPLLKTYMKEIRKILNVKLPRNKILEVLKRNGYNPNRTLVEFANYRISRSNNIIRLPTDKYMMIEPSAYKTPEKDKKYVSYSKFNTPSEATLPIRELSLVVFHVKRANAVKRKDVIELRVPRVYINDNKLFIIETEEEGDSSAVADGAATDDTGAGDAADDAVAGDAVAGDAGADGAAVADGVVAVADGTVAVKSNYNPLKYIHGIYRSDANEYHGLFELKSDKEYKFIIGIEFLSPKFTFKHKDTQTTFSGGNKYRILKIYYFNTIFVPSSKLEIGPDKIDTLSLEKLDLKYLVDEQNEVSVNLDSLKKLS